jgi:hypothetical protein
MAASVRVREVSAAVAVSAVVSFWLASRESTSRIVNQPLGLIVLRVALGPVTGWIEAAQQGSTRTALWGLIPATIFTAGPLCIWVASRARLWLVIGTIVWIAAGYFYAIAIWA